MGGTDRLAEHFWRREFACRCGCGLDTVDAGLLRVCRALRARYGPVVVTSGCRCAEHNRAEGGADGSMHLLGRAADVRLQIDSHDLRDAAEVARNAGATGIGLYYPDRLHVDTRSAPPAYWVVT